MEDNNKNINQPDAFNDLIRQKLEHHQLPIDPNGWANLEKQLQPKRKVIVWWWFGTGIAAVLALILSILPFGPETKLDYSELETRSQIETTNQTIKSSENIVTGEISNESISTYNKTIAQQSKILTKNPKATILMEKINLSIPTTKEKTKSQKNENTSVESISDIVLEKDSSSKSNLNLKNSTKKAQIKDSLAKTESVKKRFQSLENLNKNEDLIAQNNSKKTNNDWQLAAAFGSGGSTSLGNNSELFFADAGPKMLAMADANYSNILSADNFTQKIFMAPLSFGIIVRKNIGNKIGIETGLTYTYLYSTFEENRNLRADAQLKLHYLGIPVNLIVPVWKSGYWEMYLSGGGMLEKGLRSVYIQHQYYGNQTITTTAKTKIDGLQWSVNTAIGLNYKLQQNISLYFEPKVSYYLDNKQPASARTDQQVVIGLTAGVRFRF